MSLMISISGVRGIVGESLTPSVVVTYAGAFGEYSRRGTIVIGRDGRITGKIIGHLVSSTLLSLGCNVVALGVVPTPTVALAVEELGAAGGISITASHNPMEWNGLKFIGRSGMFLDEGEQRQLRAIADGNSISYAAWNGIGSHRPDESFVRRHIERALGIPEINKEAIARRRLKVVVDCINAAGGGIVPPLLRELGCRVVEMNCEVSGIFTRTPEPVPENLGALCRRVVEEKADLGIAVDPDVDRLVLITEKGEPFGEEYTVTTAVKYILEKHRGAGERVVINLSTTRAVDDIAKACGATVVRTPVGEINVASKMKEIGAVIGGEGSGGVIFPAVHYGRDAIVGIALILQQLTDFRGTLSQFKATLPQYAIVKTKAGLKGKDADAMFDTIRRKYAGKGTFTDTDGLKIDFADSWVHLRKSNTEPIIRIIAEAPTTDRAQSLLSEFQRIVG